MRELLRNPKVLVLLSFLAFGTLILFSRGLDYGIDFSGGTLYTIHLANPANAQEMEQITQSISKRLDWTGLQDTTVMARGKEIILVESPETNPDEIESIKALLMRQGKFEAMIEGRVMFSGAELSVVVDPQRGFGLQDTGNGFRWSLPFLLKPEAAQRFTEMSFHKCVVDSSDPTGYACEPTFFFIDRPENLVLVIPSELYSEEIPADREGLSDTMVSTETLILNSGAKQFVVDGNLSSAQASELEALSGSITEAIIPSSLSEENKEVLSSLGYDLRELPVENYLWDSSGVRSIIFLSDSVANMGVASLDDAETFTNLVIHGIAGNMGQGNEKLNSLVVLLKSGSLPIPVDSISLETVPNVYGSFFLRNVVWIGLFSLLSVTLIIFIRYRILKLSVPILFTGLAEVYLIICFASLINWKLDLAAVAGILAAVGTGVDDQIVITDELKRGESSRAASLIGRVRSAFFIIFAAAATTIAAMFPIMVIGSGLGKLVGFSITTIAGVLIGVFITRPAFGELAKKILED